MTPTAPWTPSHPDQQGRQHRPHGESDQPDALEGAQHPGEHPVGGHALQDRASHDVGGREADATDRDEGQGEAGRRAEADERDRRPPRDGRHGKGRRHPPAADERDARGTTQHGPETQAGIEEPGTGLAGHEDLLGEQDEQDVHRPRDDHADREEAHDQARVRARGEGPEPAGHQRGDRLGVLVILLGRRVIRRRRPGRPVWHPSFSEEASHVHHEDDGEGRRQRAERPHRAGPGHHEERRRRQRAEEHPGSLDGARHAVGGRELLRRPREPWQQGPLGGPGERGAGRLHRGSEVDEDGRGARQHAGRRDGVGDRLHDVAGEQHALPRVAVGERRGEGCDHGRRQQQDQGDDADRARSGCLVRVHEDRDVAAVEGGTEQQVRQLDPSQRRVPQHRPHDPGGHREMVPGTRDPAHGASGSL